MCASSYLLFATEGSRASFWIRTAGAIILGISHGYEVKEKDDPFVRLADIATEQFSLSTAPGVFLVNLVPACKLVTQCMIH